MKINVLVLFVLFIVSCQSPEFDKVTGTKKESWAMTDFVKVDSVNPISVPTKNLATMEKPLVCAWQVQQI